MSTGIKGTWDEMENKKVGYCKRGRQYDVVDNESINQK